jgi:hypothetical protein
MISQWGGFASRRRFCRVSLIPAVAKAVFCLIAIISLSGCLEVKQSIVLDSDGSGHVAINFVVDKAWAPMVVPDLQKALRKDMPKGMQLSDETRDEAGNSVLTANVAFRNVAELSDKDTRYAFAAEDGGFFRKTYRFEIRQLATLKSEVPIPFEFSVKMPGTIQETNGVRVSANEVKWNQSGLRKGMLLSARSSATSLAGWLIYGISLLAVVIAGWIIFSRRVASIQATAPIQKAAPVVYCTECGKQNLADGSFCTSCGQRLVAD